MTRTRLFAIPNSRLRRAGAGNLLRHAVAQRTCWAARWSAPSGANMAPRSLIPKANLRLFRGLPRRLKAWSSHGDHVVSLPDGFHATGRTDNAVAAVENSAKKSLWRAVSSRK